MTDAARAGMLDIVKVQGLTLLLCGVIGPWLLSLCGISALHLPLFYIDATGVALQVILLAVTSMFFYLDRRRAVSALAGLLLVSNASLTAASLWLDPEYYGYGFALAIAITSIAGLITLRRAFAQLVRDTFMRQPVTS